MKKMHFHWILFCITGLIIFTCASVLQDLGDCGQSIGRLGRIVGGEITRESEFPWVVSIQSKSTHFCGGFAVSKSLIVSAAHCFQKSNPFLEFTNDEPNVESFNVSVGLNNIRETGEKTLIAKAEKVFVHPDYDAKFKENDIALVTLKKDIFVSEKLVPVCLPELHSSLSYENRNATTAGWGLMSFKQPHWDWVSKVTSMQKVEVKVWERNDCLHAYEGISFPSKSFICAGSHGKDSCRGDSGGPLMIAENGKWVAIGIVSAGKKCGEDGKPGVYTDLTAFLPWIRSHI